MELGMGIITVLVILVIWTIIWKGLALWKSAQRSHKVWFIIMLIVNTAGILEIIYLLTHRNKSSSVINPQAPKSFAPPENPNIV